MKQDEIMEMARKATLDEMWELSPRFVARLEAFAKLVAAKEREACAKTLESISNAPDIKAYAAAIRSRGEA